MTQVKIYVNRPGADDIEILINFNVGYDPGDYLEPNHPCNGRGAGVICEYQDHTPEEIELSDLEMEEAESQAIAAACEAALDRAETRWDAHREEEV